MKKTLISYLIILILSFIGIIVFITYLEKIPKEEYEIEATTIQDKRQELECLVIENRTSCTIEYYVLLETGEIKISYDFYQKAIIGNEIMIKRRIK
jgi:hypothetical protein